MAIAAHDEQHLPVLAHHGVGRGEDRVGPANPDVLHDHRRPVDAGRHAERQVVADLHVGVRPAALGRHRRAPRVDRRRILVEPAIQLAQPRDALRKLLRVDDLRLAPGRRVALVGGEPAGLDRLRRRPVALRDPLRVVGVRHRAVFRRPAEHRLRSRLERRHGEREGRRPLPHLHLQLQRPHLRDLHIGVECPTGDAKCHRQNAPPTARIPNEHAGLRQLPRQRRGLTRLPGALPSASFAAG